MNYIDGKHIDFFDLKIEQGKVYLTAKFKGEAEPISASANCAIQDDALCFSEITTNKGWINALIFLFKGTDAFKKKTKIALKDISKNELVIKILNLLVHASGPVP
jgi:hypothetical protein